MTCFHYATPDMKDAYYVVLKLRDDGTILMHSPPYQTVDEMDDAMGEAELWIDQSTFVDDGGVFLDCYYVGDDEPIAHPAQEKSNG